MCYLLDTNICIHFLRGKYGVAEKFETVYSNNFAISEITLAELVYSAENSLQQHKWRLKMHSRRFGVSACLPEKSG